MLGVAPVLGFLVYHVSRDVEDLARQLSVRVSALTELLNKVVLSGDPRQHTGFNLTGVTGEDSIPVRHTDSFTDSKLVRVTLAHVLKVESVRTLLSTGGVPSGVRLERLKRDRHRQVAASFQQVLSTALLNAGVLLEPCLDKESDTLVRVLQQGSELQVSLADGWNVLALLLAVLHRAVDSKTHEELRELGTGAYSLKHVIGRLEVEEQSGTEFLQPCLCPLLKRPDIICERLLGGHKGRLRSHTCRDIDKVKCVGQVLLIGVLPGGSYHGYKIHAALVAVVVAVLLEPLPLGVSEVPTVLAVRQHSACLLDAMSEESGQRLM